MTKRRETPDVGDWIRFQRDGRVVISAVLYVTPRAEWDSTPEAFTEIGAVRCEDILETRKANPV